MGGGITLLVVMASFLPGAAVIPVHGAVQLSSNISRTVLLRKFVDKAIFIPFALASIPGAFLGAHIMLALPEGIINAMIGSFVLLVVWMPKIKLGNLKISKTKKFIGVGLLTATANMFFGAGGILLGPFFARIDLPRQAVVGTHGACMAFQHLLKVVAFVVMGFAFGAYWQLIACMVPAAMAGSWFGRKILDKCPEHLFRIIFKTVVTLLALRLLYVAFV